MSTEDIPKIEFMKDTVCSIAEDFHKKHPTIERLSAVDIFGIRKACEEHSMMPLLGIDDHSGPISTPVVPDASPKDKNLRK